MSNISGQSLAQISDAISTLNKSETITDSSSFKDIIYLTDNEMADHLAVLTTSSTAILVIVNKFTSRVFRKHDQSSGWVLTAAGEFGTKSASIITLNKRAVIYWYEVEGDLQLIKPSDNDLYETVKKSTINKWLKQAEEITGRIGTISSHAKKWVEANASWRCQICADDLKRDIIDGTNRNLSYIAHIVAASLDGPRGNHPLPPEKRNDEDNLLLLCDKCHRLIDRAAPERYTVELLRKIRMDNIKAVEQALNTLRYPEVRVVTLIGNITGQTHQFDIHDVYGMIWESQLRPSQEVEKALDFGNQLYDPHTSAYWTSLFESGQIAMCQNYLRSNNSKNKREKMAIFPKHGTSVLVLAGKIFGDDGGTYLFQPVRTEPTWRWLSGPARNFSLVTIKDKTNQENEANLIVSLTYKITSDRLPKDCFDGDYLRPTLEISTSELGVDSLSRRGDINNLSDTLDKAIAHLQDVWKVKKIHLFIGCPTTGVFKIGQKMQSRHHANFVCYETNSKENYAFKPTIEISRDLIRELITNTEIKI